jgi:hypothetical protein
LGSTDFSRQLLDDLTGVVLTPVGFTLALAGLLDRRWREYAAWLLAVFVLLVALPLKFYEANYYYLAVLPPLCIMAGLGWGVIRTRARAGRTAAGMLLIVATGLSLRYAARSAFVTPKEDRSVPAAARAVQELTTPDEPLVTMHGTAIDLLYYCDRPGWALQAGGRHRLEAFLETCRRQGARYLVAVGRQPPADLPPVAHGDGFRIYRLTAPSER